MFELNIKAATASELRLKLLDMVSHLKDVNVWKSGEPIPDEVKAAEEEIKEVAPVITQEEAQENVETAPVHEEPKQPTLEEVRAALKELRDKKGSGAVKELLKAFGADSLPELKNEDYLGALARAKTEV